VIDSSPERSYSSSPLAVPVFRPRLLRRSTGVPAESPFSSRSGPLRFLRSTRNEGVGVCGGWCVVGAKWCVDNSRDPPTSIRPLSADVQIHRQQSRLDSPSLTSTSRSHKRPPSFLWNPTPGSRSLRSLQGSKIDGFDPDSRGSGGVTTPGITPTRGLSRWCQFTLLTHVSIALRGLIRSRSRGTPNADSHIECDICLT
jgi:hypothetical protein